MLLSVFLACFVPSPSTDAVLREVQLFEAKNAMSVPMRRFAYPSDANSELGCDELDGAALTYAALDIGLDGLYISGEMLPVQMDAGVITDDDRRGDLIAGLYDRLLPLAEAHKDIEERCRRHRFEGELLLGVDRRLPWETVKEVVFTAGQAQYRRLAIRVVDPSPRAFERPNGWQRADSEVHIGPAGATVFRAGSTRAVELATLHDALEPDTDVPITVFDGMLASEVMAYMDAVHASNRPWFLSIRASRTAKPVLGTPTRVDVVTLPREAEVSVLWLHYGVPVEAWTKLPGPRKPVAAPNPQSPRPP